ncbi:MAG: ATP-binding protein [Phycisphaerae bacterium]
MSEAVFDEMKRAMGFDQRDAVNVQSLASHATPAIPEIVHRYYDQLLKHEGARAVFTGGDRQVERQRTLLSMWLHELFEGCYDETYYKKRRRFGASHVSVGLPQHYLFMAMEVIWEGLERRIRSANVADAKEKLESLHKLLVLEFAVVLESYKESYSEQVRRLERRAVEEKLTRAEHLAEIGQLAASLAHEIKNPLAGISGAIQIIRDGMVPDDPHQPIVSEILGQINRLDATVKDLLQYARPAPPRARKVPFDEVVKRVLTVLREEPALQHIRIKYGKLTTDTTVFVDDAQIEQLLINLILNAAHASDNGNIIHLGIACNSDHVQLIVRDEGKGMTPEVRERAFEPFFTTKAKGTGLGLSICRRIAEVHGGDIELQSEVGRGTIVIVTLPHNGERKARKVKP